MERNLSEGSVFKNLIIFSMPYMLSYFLQTLYGMADLFIIGQYEGIASITAVSIGSQILHMLTVMLIGLAMGTTVSIGQDIGAGNRAEASKDIGSTAILFITSSIVLTAVLLLLIQPIISAMSVPEEAVSGTSSYLAICFIGIPFITAYNIISSIFRGMGDSSTPMRFIAVACAANILLDYFFIGVLKLGPAGAALGTVSSQAISVVISFAYIIRKKLIRISRRDFIPSRYAMKKILSIGIPIALQDGLIQIAFIIITIIANLRGLDDAAAVGIVEKVMSFLFLIPSSMLSAVSALGAQNIGSGRIERAEKTLMYAVMVASGFGLVISVIVQFRAEYIISLFTDSSTDDAMNVIRLGSQYLRGYIWDCIFAGIHFSFSGYFCACGKSGLSFLHNILAITLVRIPGVYLASVLFPDTLLPMGLATASGSLLSVIICFAAFAAIRHRYRGKEKIYNAK